MLTTYFIYHDNSQGVLMRVLGAVSRRALDFGPARFTNKSIELELDTSTKTHDQLLREWRSIVGVGDVDVVRRAR
jgi:hypothetical protein